MKTEHIKQKDKQTPQEYRWKEAALKPCPFCNGKKLERYTDNEDRKYGLMCENCDVIFWLEDNVEDSIDKWNSRRETIGSMYYCVGCQEGREDPEDRCQNCDAPLTIDFLLNGRRK